MICSSRALWVATTKHSVTPVDAETNREACAPDIGLVEERHARDSSHGARWWQSIRAHRAYPLTIQIGSKAAVESGSLTACM